MHLILVMALENGHVINDILENFTLLNLLMTK